MKKLAVFAALGAALALAIGGYSFAAPGKDYSGPKCTDISGGFGDGYTTPGGGTEGRAQQDTFRHAGGCSLRPPGWLDDSVARCSLVV